MWQSSQIEQVIAVWGLRSHIPRPVRWLPPESFLLRHAALGRLTPAEGAPLDQRPATMIPSLAEGDLDVLEEVGMPGGPSIDVAVALLRRARRTPFQLSAAFSVLASPAALPEPVRIECAYLLVLNEMRAQALAVLDLNEANPRARIERPRLQEPPRAPPPAADAIAREAVFLWKHRARHALAREPAHPPPAPEEIEPELPGVSEVDVERLQRFGLPDGPTADEATATLRAVRGSVLRVRGLRYVLATRPRGPFPEAVRAVCAELLAELGYRDKALAVLADQPVELPAIPPSPIEVDVEVREGEAGARAAAAERVLARDLTAFGVRERHTRFEAVAQASRLTVEAFRAHGGRAKGGAIREAGRDLEEAGDAARAAEMYALGGDHLEAARLGVPARSAPAADADGAALLADLDALDRRGLRLAAVGAARAFLAEHPSADVAAFARGVLARLVRGPMVTLSLDGREERLALGEVVTVGRVGATILLATPLVSRVHLRLYRRDGAAMVEDLGSHNGTWLAGARLAAPLPVGTGVRLAVAREIPCSIQPAGDDAAGALVIEIAGERVLAPLGPLVLGGLRIAEEQQGEEAVVTLRCEAGIVATLGEHAIETAIELAHGDVVRAAGATTREVRVG